MDRNLTDYDPKEVETIIQVALLCTQSLPEDRPDMAQVVGMLQGVGLAESWAQREQREEVRNQEPSLSTNLFAWADELTHGQEAIELSEAR